MPNSNPTQRLTTGQAVVKFLAAQHVERDGETSPFFGGAIGIFGHGNVAGIGQALLQYRKDFRLYQARNEQGMVHMATGYAKAKNRLGALACSTSIQARLAAVNSSWTMLDCGVKESGRLKFG